MAGCTKAGRYSKNPSNKRYKSSARWAINKEKRIAKEKARLKKILKVPRGSARKNRRITLQQNIVMGFV